MGGVRSVAPAKIGAASYVFEDDWFFWVENHKEIMAAAGRSRGEGDGGGTEPTVRDSSGQVESGAMVATGVHANARRSGGSAGCRFGCGVGHGMDGAVLDDPGPDR